MGGHLHRSQTNGGPSILHSSCEYFDFWTKTFDNFKNTNTEINGAIA